MIIWIGSASLSRAKRSMSVETGMRRPRKLENAEERCDRLKGEAQRKANDATAADRAIDRMIRENIRLYGP
jgi:hypothetical protein